MGLFGGVWEVYWGHIGGHRSKQGVALIGVPPTGPEKSPLGAHLGRSWGALGRSWARLGPLWGLSWGSLGPSWGHLEASRAHCKPKGEKAKNIDFPKVFEGFWPLGGVLGRLRGHLGPSWGGLGASCRHVGSYLESSRAILSDLGGHLELSWALLAPSLPKTDAPTTRGTPPPGPGGGGRGRGKPFPEGEEGG